MDLAKKGGIMTEAGSDAASTDKRHRDCHRIELDLPELANIVWERLCDHIPSKVMVGNGHPPIPGVDQSHEWWGEWEPYGVNHKWRIVCYPGKGHFAPHRDSDYQASEHERSFLTINGYLTALPAGVGGATRFLTDDQPAVLDDQGRFGAKPGSVLDRIEDDLEGKSVIFFHRLMHDGEPLQEGSPPKWLFRTEVMYRRKLESAPQFTKEQIQAREFLKEAEQAENEKRLDDAMKFYNKAYKLDPSLETM
mmetsp:Transcript_8544/g.17736  ORF Transcript_8544/g.17736 Transcript_8544/m.17736 type:complete len:250 (+) Transcript_8544:2-751(+)